MRRSERKSLGCFGTQTEKSVHVSLVINTLNHRIKRTSRCQVRGAMAAQRGKGPGKPASGRQKGKHAMETGNVAAVCAANE